MFCKSCGTQIADNAKFCDACGMQTSTEQENILAQQEKTRQEHPPAYLDVKTAVIITVMLFIILPIPCAFSGVPAVLGFAVAGVMSAFCIIMGIRNQIKHKNKKK